MRTAFAYWNSRIAPVFDTARLLRVIDAEKGRISAQTEEVLEDDLPQSKVDHLLRLGIATLVCGAISRDVEALLSANDIIVVPFVAGELEEIIRAYLKGQLDRKIYAMPGCCARRGWRGTARVCCDGVAVQKGLWRRGMQGTGAASASSACDRCGNHQSGDSGGRCPQCGDDTA